MNIEETLKRLSAACGPAGAEGEAAALAASLLGEYMPEVYTDPMGSVIAHMPCKRESAPRVLVEAHLDEIGFVVTGANEGFLTFAPVGSVDPRHLPGARLRVLSQPEMTGVVAALPPHVLTAENMEKALGIDELYLDVGLTQEQAAVIALGTPIVYDVAPALLGDGAFTGKALDNRASIAAVLLALDMLGETPLDVELYVMASVQEEVGCRGASAGAFAVNPDYCISLDVTFGRTPDTSREQTVEFGGGAAIGVGTMLNRAMTDRLREIAQAQGIAHQLEVLAGRTATTADVFQITREGVPTALISTPLRYMHSPAEVVSMADVEAVARLLAAALVDMGKGEAYA